MFVDIFFLSIETELIMLIRILLSTMMGFLIGLQRSKTKHNNTILRTHIFICIGSCLIAITGEYLLLKGLSIDITRLAAQVISGIGFIGMGVIMKTKENHVSGLTTATTIWVAGCIGIATGFGIYLPSIITTLLVLIFLVTIKEKNENEIHK